MLDMPLGTVKGRMRLGLEKIAQRGWRRGCDERDGPQRAPRADDLAAYALGALEPERGARASSEHLESCEDCRADLRWLAPAVTCSRRRWSSWSRPRSCKRAPDGDGSRRTSRAERGGRGHAARSRWSALRRDRRRPAPALALS